MKRRFALAIGVLVLTVCLAGCGASPRAIRKKPEKYAGKKVSLNGVVREVISVSAAGAAKGGTLYKLKTGNGPEDWIWVFRGGQSSDKIVPLNNAPIKTKGIVNTEMTLRGMKYAPILDELSGKQDMREPPPGSVQY